MSRVGTRIGQDNLLQNTQTATTAQTTFYGKDIGVVSMDVQLKSLRMKGALHPLSLHIFGIDWQNENFTTEQVMKAQKGSTGIALFFLSPRRGVGWLTRRPGRFTSEKEIRYPFYRGVGKRQGRSGRVSPPPRFDSRTVQLVASRYTDWGISAHGIDWRNFICLYLNQTHSLQ
jgi:hypothetical protein